jgi:hypothetical protein
MKINFINGRGKLNIDRERKIEKRGKKKRKKKEKKKEKKGKKGKKKGKRKKKKKTMDRMEEWKKRRGEEEKGITERRNIAIKNEENRTCIEKWRNTQF